jgi:hypothetical protein
LKSQKGARLNFRISGRNLPGIKFSRSQGALVDREPVYVGIQRRNEVIDLVPGDASKAVFDFQIELEKAGGKFEFRGPFVHGKKGDRFLYLSWGELAKNGEFTMFRRAKLLLNNIKSEDLAGALSSSGQKILEATIDLTDAGGGPLCGGGKVVAEKTNWHVVPAITSVSH